MNKAAFETKYNDASTGIYKAGQSEGIGSDDHRTMIEDIADNTMFIDDNFIDEDSFASDSATKAPSQQSTKAYIANQLAGSSSINNTDIRYFEVDDFIFGTTSKSIFSFGSSGTGAGQSESTYGINTTENAFGTLALSTGTTTTGRCHMFRYGVSIGTHAMNFRYRTAIQAVSDGTETYSLRIGISDLSNISGGDPNNGIFFRYTHSVNSGKYECVCRASSTETTLDSGLSAGTTFQILEIRVNQAGTSVGFYINGTLAQTISTNIPTSGSVTNFYAQILKSAGTTAREVYFDYFDLLSTRATAR